MNSELGSTLYQLRMLSEETQENVADSVDLSRIAYHRYENNEREPRASTAIRLAQHFGVTVEYLYGVESNPSVTPRVPEEISLLEVFRSLSREKKDDLLQYADFLIVRQSEEKGRTASAG